MQHRAKLSVAPVDLERHAPRSANDDDSLDDQRSSCGSEKETRVQPLEPLVKTRKDGSVRVAVRIRPPLPWELARNAVTCVKTLRDSANTVQVTAGAHPAKKFTFDHVFSQAVKQTEVYDEVLHPWMESFLQGFNVTVIAYGQTGSGKTYTMGNNLPSACMVANSMFASPPSCDDSTDEESFDTLDNNEGLIPRSLHHLFTRLDKKKRKVKLSVSFLEIYGQDIYDLLDSPATQRLGRRSESLQLRENAKNGVWVQGLKEVRVSSRQEALDHMQRGALQRITASTQMNKQSSRSHAVYTVKIVQRVSDQNVNMKKSNKLAVGSSSSNDVATDAIESDTVIVSKLTFVDLAGSERLKKTLAEGDRMKEGIQINAGLFALGNVINALGDDKRRGHSQLHVPYRSSKLTRLLQDALGGNSRTLFIACVSSADLHANETLHTLMYANRAKNIQNKAVKNINSRSAELANLKAYNQLLCRELVKAILAEYKRGAHGDIDSLADVCMSNPDILSYFGSIEQLSASAGLMLSSNERTFEVRRLLNSLTSHLYGLVPKNGYRRAASLTSGIKSEPKRVSHRDELPGFKGNIGSSIVSLEEGNPDAYEALTTTCSLGKLCRTLEIMSFAFEMLEIKRGEKWLRQSVDAKRMKLETQYRRQEFLQNGLSGTIDRMQTWLSSSTLTQDTRRSIRSSVEAAQRRLALMAIGMEDLKDQISRLSCDQQLALESCQKEWIAKHDQLNEMREAQDKATTNTLDTLIWKTEIELRFDSYDLDSISELLVDEEKELTAYIAGGDGAIPFISPLFTKEELALSQHCELYSMIHDQLRNAFDNEILEASMNKELRKRTQLIHKISNGPTACLRDGMTKNMFMEENERLLIDCENSVSQIREAMLARRCQRATMAEILDSIGSLDAAKVLIRRLVIQVYSHWRNDMAFDEKEEAKKQKKIEEIVKQNLAVMETDMDAKLDTIEAKYEKDLKSAFQMVTSFNDVVRSGGHSLVHNPSRQAKAKATVKISLLEEREKMLIAELADSKKEMVAMRLELDRLQASARSAERKEEAFRVMSRCQEIWQELGVNDEDQASKFQDINGLLMKKCSEELESLEAAREMIQARINDTCRVVSRMESFLRVTTPLRIQSLPVVAGGSLMEQEKYVLLLQKGLSNELWQNLNARVQLSADIRKLSGDLQIQSCKDFRHVADDALVHFDTDFLKSIAVEFDAWKPIAQNVGAAKALDQFMDSLDEGTDLSRMSIQRGENIFNIMLTEKMKRIAEVEECVTAIRAIARKSQLSQDDVGSVIRSMLYEEDFFDGGIDTKSTVLEDLCAHIFQTGGRLDFGKHRLEVLAKVLCSLEEVQAGRSDVLSFLHRIVEEAVMLTHDVALSGHGDDIFCHFTFPLPPIPRGDQSFVDTLAAGKEILCCLSDPVVGALRSLLYSMDDDFAAFGIDTKEQRMSFLGCRIDDKSSRLAILDKYVVRLPCAVTTSSNDGNLDIGVPERAPGCNDSFLSRLDPAFEEFRWTYSVSFGDSQLQRLRNSIADIQEVRNAMISAQIRLKSLRRIMVIYNKINEFKSKIAEFEACASQKDRLFGNSLVLLEEERFRKTAAKHYPNLLAALRKEVSRWLENEGGEYDLSVLGKDLKNLLLDMMNTNTDLMHLDLGIVSRASKQMMSRTSSSTNLQPTATDSNQRTTSKIFTPSRNNVRNQSTNEQEPFQQ